jgi:hypothetical protein
MDVEVLVRRWYLAVIAALASGGACAGGAGSPAMSSVRDSLGIRIVENRAPVSSGFLLTLDSTPVIDLGGASGGLREEFSGFVFPVRLSNGRLVVANSGSHELRAFDAGGNFDKPIGRTGDGPGEFRSLAWLNAGTGDTLRTYDWNLLRVSVFSDEGVFQRSMYLGVPSEMVGLRLIGVLGDGRLIARTQNAVTVTSQGGVRRDTVAILAYTATGQLGDTVGWFPGNEEWIERGEKSVSASDRPFGKKLFAVAHQSVIFVGTADAPEVLVERADGSLVRIIRWTSEPAAVTSADIDAYIKHAGNGWSTESEAMRDRYLARLRDAPFPRTKPVYSGLVVSASGALWVRRYDEPASATPAIFEVFDSTGTWQGAVRLPPRFAPTQITPDYVLGTWTDQDDVVHVRMYRFAGHP